MLAELPISIVLSSYEEGYRLHETVKSVVGSKPRPAQVIIVDDGSTDGSCDGPWPSGVSVLRLEHRGIATARNAGAVAAVNSVLVFLDAQCCVESNWLDPLYQLLQDHPGGLVGATVADYNDSRSRGCGATLINPMLEYRWDPPSQVRPVQIVPGGCMAVTRTTFLTEGGFGPFFGFGFEDVDLSLRWHGARRPVLAAPDSIVVHQFRERAPYPWERQHFVNNLLKAATRNLSGERLYQTIVAAAHLPGFAAGIAELTANLSLVRQSRYHENIECCLMNSRAWKR